MFAWILLKRAANNFKNVGIILRMIGDLKEFLERIIGELSLLVN